MIFRGIVVLIQVLALCLPGQSQEIVWEADPDKFLEAVLDPGSEDNLDEACESLMDAYHYPVNLNTADREVLRSLLLFDEQEISAILAHRQEYGNFVSVRELYLINGLDSLKIEPVLNLIRADPVMRIPGDSISWFRKIFRYGRGRLVIRYGRSVEKRMGFINRNDPDAVRRKRYYLGSPDQVNLRFNFEVPEDLQVGLTAEKDPGEKIFFSPESYGYGMDHYAGYFQKHFHSAIKNLIIGDFRIQAGQGVVMGHGLFVGKGTEPIRTVLHSAHGARPYQGSTEYGFFRGIAVDLGERRWDMTAFYSRKGLDASIGDSQELDGQKVIRSLSGTGYHRTPAELSRKNAAFMQSAGIMAVYRSLYNNLTIGMATIWNRLNLPVSERKNYYNRFDFSGHDQFNAGLNYNYYRGKFNVFGEVAVSRQGGIGMVQGIIANLGAAVETVLHIRHYDPHYFTFCGSAFGEYSANRNEQGIYWGLTVIPAGWMNINFYVDLFRSKWLRYGSAAPGSGNEWMFRLNITGNKHSAFEIYFRQETKARNLPAGTGAGYIVTPAANSRGRLGYRYQGSGGLILQSRIQGSVLVHGLSHGRGFALIQDAGFRFPDGYIKCRLAYFNTDGYDTRQYVYEPDVLYYYASPAYFGKGFRYMLLIKLRPMRNFDFWIKFGQFIYPDEDSTGSGLDEIPGNKKTEIRCQIGIKF